MHQNPRSTLPRLALLLAIPLALAPLHAEDNWPRFLGPTGQSLSDATGLPTTWSETEHVKWKTAIHGRGWSSPVVWGDQIWLTTASEDARELFVLTVDRASGKILRDLKLFDVAKPQFIHAFNSAASPTPAIEEGRVYVTFGSPGTACLDTTTGKVLWERRDFVCDHWRGAGSSPVIWGDLLLLHFDGADFQYVVALDKLTGKTVWKTDRAIDFQDLKPDGKPAADGDFRKAFSTPLVITHQGKPLLLSVGSKATYGYEPATGKELWRVEDRKFHSGSVCPLYGHDLIFTATGLAKGELWAVRPGGAGIVTDTHVAWKVSRNVPNRPSPVLVGDLLFMVAQDTGVVTCLEAKTGTEIWSERLPGKGSHSATPLHADGRLYFSNENGESFVLAAGREFKVLATNKLAAGFMASPAVTGKSLILRTKTDLYRIEN